MASHRHRCPHLRRPAEPLPLRPGHRRAPGRRELRRPGHRDGRLRARCGRPPTISARSASCWMTARRSSSTGNTTPSAISRPLDETGTAKSAACADTPSTRRSPSPGGNGTTTWPLLQPGPLAGCRRPAGSSPKIRSASRGARRTSTATRATTRSWTDSTGHVVPRRPV